MIEELIVRVFNTRSLAHLEHLRTKSFAQHTALGEFYESIIGDIDSVVECYQGAFGLIKVKYIPECKCPTNIITHLEEEVKWVSDNRTNIAQGVTAIENLIDNLTGTYFNVIYKLKNLS